MSLPGIVVTGASGFIGRHFLEAVTGKYRLFCLARRSCSEAGIPPNDNMRWTQVDIAKWDTLRDVVDCIKDHGGADYVLHLAGYYDFSNTENPEYDRTNVRGTRNVLKLAQLIGTKRLLFASSLAACEFPRPGEVVNEDSAPDAKFPYARSKRAGEEMMKEYSEWFPCAIVRLAAVFSDWCEYPPLYMFLKDWLSRKWNARILGGRGESAVTYIHIHDLIRMFLRIIEKSDSLPRLYTCIASPSGSMSHIDLFKTATRYFYGQVIKPIRFPKFLAIPGVALRRALGHIKGEEPFERIWMTHYIDRKLMVDASRTHKELDWEPILRYEILRRLLFLIERIKNYPDVWLIRNEAALRRITRRPNFMIYDFMVEVRESVIDEIKQYVIAPEHHSEFLHYQEMDENLLKWYITLIYQLTATAVRTRDRTLMRHYAQIIAYRRFGEGFDVEEVCSVMLAIGNIIGNAIRSGLEMKDVEQRIYDHITMTFQLVVDELSDSYELISAQSPEFLRQIEKVSIPASSGDMERIVHQLEDICQDMCEYRLSVEGRGLREETFL